MVTKKLSCLKTLIKYTTLTRVSKMLTTKIMSSRSSITVPRMSRMVPQPNINMPSISKWFHGSEK